MASVEKGIRHGFRRLATGQVGKGGQAQMQGKLTCGLIGLSQGWYANLFATELVAMKDVELVGVCDLGKSRDYVLDCIGIDAEEFAAKFETAPLP